MVVIGDYPDSRQLRGERAGSNTAGYSAKRSAILYKIDIEFIHSVCKS